MAFPRAQAGLLFPQEAVRQTARVNVISGDPVRWVVAHRESTLAGESAAPATSNVVMVPPGARMKPWLTLAASGRDQNSTVASCTGGLEAGCVVATGGEFVLLTGGAGTL